MRLPSSLWWISVLAALALAGCYEDNEVEPEVDAAPPVVDECTGAESRSCFVEDGCQGTQTCSGGQFGACAAPEETCDGQDNDCDGTIDEDFADLGDACQAGQGKCIDQGRIVCTADGTGTECDAQPGDATAEVCDGVDNDCNGTIDDGVEVGVACETGQFGACSAGTTACEDGDTVCQPTVEATTETCDGLDNDCDSNTDEGEEGGPLAESCYEGPDGTEGVGTCAAGFRTCVDGMFSACEGAVEPGDETCDEIDNDCDGETDNVADGECVCVPGTVEPCYAGPEGTEGVGVCRAGTRTCNAAGTAFSTCDGERAPGVELCDGLDNDCNGMSDDVAGAGDDCGAGQGACAVQGTRVCDLETGQLVCNAEAGLPAVETCDGIDNDCDGQIDDVAGAGEPCQTGVGACLGRGVQRCDVDAGALVCSAVAAQPAAEFCNNIDDDCDGEIDDVPGLGIACEIGTGACRSTAETVCDTAAGAVVCPATPQDPAPADYCGNGIDDNCDGATDEDECTSLCVEDDDCPAPGEICVEGECDVIGCEIDEDCPPDQSCQGAICVPAELCFNAIDDDRDGDIDCADADCQGNPACDVPSGCGLAESIGFGVHMATAEGDSAFALASCTLPRDDTDGPEVVFAFATEAAGTVCVDTQGSAFDTVLTVRRDPCEDAASEIACNDDRGDDFDTTSQVDFEAMAGMTYFIVVDTFAGESGEVRLTVTDGPCAPAPGVEICDNTQDDDGDGDTDCADEDCANDPACQDPDICVGVDPIALGLTEGLVEGPSRINLASCTRPIDGATGPEAVHAFVPENDGPHCVDTRGSQIDTVLTVRTGTCTGAADEIACNDDTGFAFDSEVGFDAAAGDTYYIIVDTFAGESGGYALNIREGACDAPGFELCDNGEDDDGDGDVDCGDEDCDVDPTCQIPCVPDAFEPNETLEDAAPVEIATFSPLSICADDTDWYSIEVCAGGVLTIDVLFSHAAGDIDVELSDLGGLIDASDTATDDEQIIFANGGETGTYYINVFGFRDAQNTYDLAIDITDCDGDGEVICDDGIDNDDDGATDCADDDCGADPACAEPGEEGELRLAAGDDERSGRLEVYHDGAWGTVCDDGWNDGGPTSPQGFQNADVACRQLGFAGAEGLYNPPDGVDPIWMDDVRCVGNEGRLVDCPFSGFGVENCGHNEDIGLRCLADGACRVDTQCEPGQVCLDGACVGGAREICDNGIDDNGDGDIDCDDAECALLPVCVLAGCPDVAREPNESIAAATPVAVGEYVDLAICGLADQDFYAIEICAGGTITIDVLFTHADGDIDVQLRNAANTVVDDSTGTADNEQIIFTNAGATALHYIRVLGFLAAQNDYSMTIGITCPDPVEICDNDMDDDADETVDCQDPDCADAGVCVGAVEGDIRLVGGVDERTGRLEVFHNGVWGTVCDDLWELGVTTTAQGFTNGDVACRQLGFVGAATTFAGLGGVDPTWLDQVTCAGNEERLIDCPANPLGTEDCGHTEDIGLTCLADGACRIDAHCEAGSVCVGGVCRGGVRENCNNAIDDDGDGAIDCADDECAALLECVLAACPDRDREPNDAIATATPVAVGNYPDLAICGPVDQDFYGIEICGGGTITIDVLFAHAAGDIELQLRSAANAVLRSSTSSDDNEQIVYTHPGATAMFFVRVYGSGGAQNDYSLGLAINCPPPAPEICNNGIDDDRDGAIDCADPNCAADPICVAPVGPTPIAAPGATVRLAGAIDAADPTWTRPLATCAARPGSVQYYDAYRIVNNTGAPQRLTLTAAWADDGFLHVFSDPFNPAASPAGCVAGSDDFNGELGSRIVDVQIAPGQVLVVVASTFDPRAAIGPYTIDVLTQAPPAVELCADGIDNDADTLIDCLDPDCALAPECVVIAECPDAANEPNEDADTATDIVAGDYPGLAICGADDLDFYAIEVCAGGIISVDVAFIHANGDIDITLGDGLRVDASSETTADLEQIVFENEGATATYYITVFGFDGAENDYSLAVAIDCPQPAEICDNGADDDGDAATDCDDADCIDDPACEVIPECPDSANEPNDDAGTATDIVAGDYPGLAICGVDDLDFYAIEICAGGIIAIDVAFTHANGDLDITLGDGLRVDASSETTDDLEQIVFENEGATATYYITVFGFEGAENDYSLSVAIECPVPVEICDNDLDDDGDALIDCEDDDCVADPACEVIAPRAPQVGDLAITEIMYDPTAIGDANGEYIEVQNISRAPLELQGLRFRDNSANTGVVVANSLIVQPGGYIIAVRQGAPAINGGIAADVTLGNLLQLGNDSDIVRITIGPIGAEVELDSVNYIEGAVGQWPAGVGVSIQLGNEYDPRVVNNNDRQFWCLSTQQFGPGDRGTPRAANTRCSPEPVPVDFCRLQFPPEIEGAPGDMVTVYGRFFEAGLTDRSNMNDADARARGQLGYLLDGADPANPASWTWIDAIPNPGYVGGGDETNNDEHQATFPLPIDGLYLYAFRFTVDNAVSWTLCDLDGAGSNLDGGQPGRSFSFDQAGVMLTETNFCNEACADVFACNFGAVAGFANQQECLDACNGGAVTPEEARCIANALGAPPAGCNLVALAACQAL